MKFAISLLSVLCFLFHGPLLASANSFENILKQAAIAKGALPAEQLYENSDKDLVEIGKVFFESEDLSLNGKISCKSCPLKNLVQGMVSPMQWALGERVRVETEP